MSQEDFDCIDQALKNLADGKLKPVYDYFEEKYSYRQIQLVRLFSKGVRATCFLINSVKFQVTLTPSRY